MDSTDQNISSNHSTSIALGLWPYIHTEFVATNVLSMHNPCFTNDIDSRDVPSVKAEQTRRRSKVHSEQVQRSSAKVTVVIVLRTHVDNGEGERTQ